MSFSSSAFESRRGFPCAVSARDPSSTTHSLALIGQSMPTFWIGILLILVFAVAWPVLPTGGSGTPTHLILPALTLGLYVSAAMLRVTRAAMIDALGHDYVRTARSKGLSDRATVLGHALPNAATPILGITLLEAATVLRGAVVTETVFAWPGVGKLAVDAVYARDFPVVLAAVLFMGSVFLVLSLVAELLQAQFDPRVRSAA
jgi:peptide/nickel transport system permease protein